MCRVVKLGGGLLGNPLLTRWLRALAHGIEEFTLVFAARILSARNSVAVRSVCGTHGPGTG